MEYNHLTIEQNWQQFWLEKQIYSWDDSCSSTDKFTIDTPPPTVSGTLHMGHVFSYAQADFIARYQRMKGKNVFYPMGFDDNGLPTERLVEKIKGVRANQLPRHEFIAMCQEVVAESEEEFRALFKSIGLSVDWNHEYQTISSRSRALSQMSFIDLYNKGLINRVKSPSFWDVVDQTALAQAEIEDKEKSGVMVEIIFKLAPFHDLNSTDNISVETCIIATTRPEMIPACVALLYNPADNRYKHLAGKFALTPIFEAKVPIIADSNVEIAKGTGLVMCCTFGDIQDIVWWREHNLSIKDCINKYGKMQNAGILNAMKINEARSKMIEILSESNLISAQTNIVRPVKCGERSGAPLEIIVTEQWYINVLDQRDKILKMGEKCKWYPDYMKIRFDNWVNGLNQDWCISRQRYFGVPFPVWYSTRKGEEGKVILADTKKLPIDPLIDLPEGYNKDEVIPDVDIMDTWATSALTPQLSSWAITDKLGFDLEKHNKLFPFDLRPQAHEIIRTWTFGTIVKALYHQNTIPWHNIMLSGWCLAADKSKMSKSKGNVVTPTSLILEKGADVVRYWASNSKLGTDITYSDETFKIGRKLLLKLYNATKFCLTHIQNLEQEPSASPADDRKIISEDLDIWVLHKLKECIKNAEKDLDNFEYCGARMVVENFFWNVLCDNYLELIKDRIYTKHNSKSGQSAILTLYHCIATVLKLFAPFIPHITEEMHYLLSTELCNRFGGDVGAIPSINKRGTWPKINNYPEAIEEVLAYGDLTIGVLAAVRKFKSTNNISIKQKIEKLYVFSDIEQGKVTNTAIIPASCKNFSVTEPLKIDRIMQNLTDVLLSDLHSACNVDCIEIRHIADLSDIEMCYNKIKQNDSADFKLVVYSECQHYVVIGKKV